MTPSRLMRTLLPPSSLRISKNAVSKPVVVAVATPSPPSCRDPTLCLSRCRCFAQVNDSDRWNRDFWFSSTCARYSLQGLPGDTQPPDERKIQLGKTVRTIHERLPTLLREPLPTEILSPSISLHLFPSTHPHLPTVSGRLAYVAALWTAPIAWGRMPLIGDVSLTILSERMVPTGMSEEDKKLVVKWETCGKTTHRDGTGGIYRGMGLAATKDPVDKIKSFIAGAREGQQPEKRRADPEEFCGIFVFEFDEKGRVAKHTIEHTDEGGHWDRMTRVVSVTDWLLGQINGKKTEDTPALAWCEERPNAGSIRLVDRRPRYRM